VAWSHSTSKTQSIPKTNSIVGSKEPVIAAGMIDLPEMPTRMVLDIYKDLVEAQGLEPNPEFQPPPTFVRLITETDLTRGEAIHAFDVVFALNGFKAVAAADGKIKVVQYSCD
jgi:hypothetical protein